jgi:hypothetical protein
MRELRARLSLLGFCLCSVDVFLVLLPLFVLVLLVFAFAVVRVVSDERLSVFRAWRSFCRRLYIRDVYVRSYSSPRSNSLHSPILRYSLRHSSLVFFALDTLTKYLSLLLDTSLVSLSTRSLHFAASYPAEPYIFLPSFLAMSQELDAQMQVAPAANPAVDAWRQLADLVSIANGIAPVTTPRPSIPAGTPAGFAASIHRAYRCGGQAYHQPNLDLEPEIPADVGTSKCAVALWEFFWQGYRYSETVATKVPASGSGSSNASSKDAKINKPENFNGERDKFADFVVQLHLVFNNEEAAFRNDNAKISYAGALPRGAAKKWFTSHVNQETGAIAFTSWAQFMKRFRASFQDSHEKTAAERMLLNLQQGTEPCASYHASFVSYMATLDWDENSKIATFRRGLRPEIKDLLVGRDLPDSFDEYVALCIRLDNSWRERAGSPEFGGSCCSDHYQIRLPLWRQLNCRGDPLWPHGYLRGPTGPTLQEGEKPSKGQ